MASKTHVKLTGSKRERNLTAFRVRNVDPKEKVIATIGLSGPKLPGADEFVGQTMTPKELEEKFGTRGAAASKVTKCLKKFGLEAEVASLLTRSMRVSGTAEAMEAAFKPNWAIMRSPSLGAYRGRQGTIHIPAELKGIVTGVFGLDQRRTAHRKSAGTVSVSHGTALSPLTPTDIEERYNFPDGDGEGQSIAIAEFGGGYFPEDMIAYCKKFQRPVPNVQRIAIERGCAYTFKQLLELQNPEVRHRKLDESFEVMMDVEIIAGLCPKASISVYFSTFDQSGWVGLLDKVITARPIPVTLSISWGHAEDDRWTKDAINAINDRLNLARLLGITICVASGDDGWKDQVYDGSAHVDFPSSSPHVMGVGGTMLEHSGASVKEVTWTEDQGTADMRGGATGGGVSRLFPRPVWQNVRIASLNPGSIDGRVVPDVSALAGEPYYDLFFAQFPWPDGKTSAAAPVWAALIARINAKLPQDKQQRFLTPLLYKKLANGQTVGKVSLRDITVGKNVSYPHPGKGYKSGPGFDAATGWGVPNGVKLLNCLAQI